MQSLMGETPKTALHRFLPTLLLSPIPDSRFPIPDSLYKPHKPVKP
ncbi:MAG: hypothetical protein F6K26_24300 [Moorea sp. SIO2I5]|nr:hypothetical protein [Moorena sp. SIO2I5]